MAAFRPTLRLRLGGVAASILIRETGDFEVEPPSFASDPTVDIVGVPGGEAVAGDLVVVSDGISRLAAVLVGTRQSPAAAAANRSLRRLLAREVAVDTIFFCDLLPLLILGRKDLARVKMCFLSLLLLLLPKARRLALRPEFSPNNFFLFCLLFSFLWDKIE